MKILLFILLNFSLLFSQDIAFDADKQKHFAASFLIGTATGIYMEHYYKENSYSKNLIIGTGIALVPGIVKELYDESQKNNSWDNADMLYNFLGSLTGNILGNYISQNIFIDIKEKKIAYNVRF